MTDDLLAETPQEPPPDPEFSGEPIEVAGEWIGEVYGTNVGKASVHFDQSGPDLTGEARFMDDLLGPTAYAVSGQATDRVKVTLTPTVVPDGVTSGKVTCDLELGMDGKLHGRWSSELGTGGVLGLGRYLLPSQVSGTVPEQSALAPARVYNASHNVGAVRLDRDALRNLVEIIRQEFSVGRAVISYTPKGGSQRIEFADTLLANKSITDTLENVIINIQEAEPNTINRGVTVELDSIGGSNVRTYGSVEAWVVGKAATVFAEVSKYQRGVITRFKKHGLDINGFIILIAIAFLPTESWLVRLNYLLLAIAIAFVLRRTLMTVIPMTEVRLGPSRPGWWTRFGVPALSWALSILSAILIAVLSGLLSNSTLLRQLTAWLGGLFGLESTPG